MTARGSGRAEQFDVIDFGISLGVDGLTDAPGEVSEGIDVGEIQIEAMGFHEEEPVAAPGDIAGDGSDAGDLDGQVVGLAMAGDVGDGDGTVGVEGGGDGADGGVDAECTGVELVEVGEGDNEADGAVAAHAEVADVVEEEDAGLTGGVMGRDEEGTHHDIRTTGFVDDGGAEGVELILETPEAVGQGTVAEVGAALEDDAGGFTAGMGVEDADPARGGVGIHGEGAMEMGGWISGCGWRVGCGWGDPVSGPWMGRHGSVVRSPCP